MEDQQQGEKTYGRSLAVFVRAASLDGLELDALDKAREFFGQDARIEVVRDYQAHRYDHKPPEERYSAAITIREVTGD